MKKYEPTEEEIEEQNLEKEAEQPTVYSEDTVLKKRMNSRFIPKTDFLGKSIKVTINGLGKNQFGRDVLLVEYKKENRSINISVSNYNWLIDNFGENLKDWKGQEISIYGTEFEGDPDKNINAGILLELSKA